MAKKEENSIDVRKIEVDASGIVLGRLVSYVAKQSLLGKTVIVVNCENALLTGRKPMIIKEYNQARARGGTSLNGPHFPNTPARIIKRTSRGMVKYDQGRGLAAYKRILCYDGLPAEFADSKKINFAAEKSTKTITLAELCQRM